MRYVLSCEHILPFLAHFGYKALGFAILSETFKIQVLCHQQEIPENGADLAHLNFLHRIGANEGSDIINSIDLSLENIFQVTHTWNGEWFSLEDQVSLF